MMLVCRRTRIAYLGMLLYAWPAAGQDSLPERPRLPSGWDPNAARAYLDMGLDSLTSRPQLAANAFYWASRLEPGWGEPLYARRVALLLAQPRTVQLAYLEGRKSVRRSPEILRIDSLGYRAMLRTPFMHRGLDQYLLIAPTTDQIIRKMRHWDPRADVLRPELESLIGELVTSGGGLGLGPDLDGWLAYSAGRFPLAFDYFDEALKRDSKNLDIHLLRADMFFRYGQYDSTAASVRFVLDELRRRDAEDLIILYESKALYEFSLGHVLQVAGDTTGAREAYARALLEDLSFYPAHLRLAGFAAAEHDQAATLAALELAAQIATADAVPQLALGQALEQTGHLEEAMAPLQRAIALEPFFAEPYLVLGLVFEHMTKLPEAVECLDSFLGNASMDNPRRRWVQSHRDSLALIVGGRT
jgi:tetratricopeptide (TPR) repeat protein